MEEVRYKKGWEFELLRKIEGESAKYKVIRKYEGPEDMATSKKFEVNDTIDYVDLCIINGNCVYCGVGFSILIPEGDEDNEVVKGKK